MYHNKYIKYKTKYLNLKAGNINTTYKYMFITDYFEPEMVDKLMAKRGNWVKSSLNDAFNHPLTFLYIDGENIIDPKYFKIKSKIKNILGNSKIITSKDGLYKTLKSTFPSICNKYMQKQYYITDDNYKSIPKKIFDNDIWIIKPTRGMKGRGNEIFESYDEYMEYVTKNKNTYVGRYGYVLEKYITNPLLIDGFKFHIRIYFLYFKYAGIRKGYIFKYGDMIFAKHKYENINFKNKAIHDTHYSGMEFMMFPDDLVSVFGDDIRDIVFDQCKVICKAIIESLDGECYPENDHCYEIFGGDFLITEDYKVKMLENNDKIGLGGKGEKWYNMFNKYLDGMLKVTVDKIIPPKIPQPDNEDWVEL